MKINEAAGDPERWRGIIARYWPKVDVRSSAECWPWVAKARAAYGYGRMSAGRGCQLRAHQIAYVIQYGAIPDGLHVLHDCDNTGCCNPFHLRAGTQKENMADAKKRGRWVKPLPRRGEKHHFATISDASVLAIRESGEKTSILAANYQVSANTIRRIRNFESRA